MSRCNILNIRRKIFCHGVIYCSDELGKHNDMRSKVDEL